MLRDLERCEQRQLEEPCSEAFEMGTIWERNGAKVGHREWGNEVPSP